MRTMALTTTRRSTAFTKDEEFEILKSQLGCLELLLTLTDVSYDAEKFSSSDRHNFVALIKDSSFNFLQCVYFWKNVENLEFSGIVFIPGKINIYFVIFNDEKMKMLCK